MVTHPGTNRAQRRATADGDKNNIATRLPSNLRQTTRECVYFWSRDKDGGHAIRSAESLNRVLHANFTALSSIEPELLPIAILHCGMGNFALFCSCDLDLDPMTFIYKPDLYPVKICPQTKNELSTSKLSKVSVLHKYGQTETHTATETIQRSRIRYLSKKIREF